MICQGQGRPSEMWATPRAERAAGILKDKDWNTQLENKQEKCFKIQNTKKIVEKLRIQRCGNTKHCQIYFSSQVKHDTMEASFQTAHMRKYKF